MKFTIKTPDVSSTYSDVSWKQAYNLIKEYEKYDTMKDVKFYMEVWEPVTPFRNELVKYVFRNDNWLPVV